MKHIKRMQFIYLLSGLLLLACQTVSGIFSTDTPAATQTRAPTTSPSSTSIPAAIATSVPTATLMPTQTSPADDRGLDILARVLERGTLVCGGRTDLAGFGFLDATGRNVGFDIDICRAVAAAVLGNPNAIEVIPLSAADRGPSLLTAEVDLLSRNVTWTTSRDAQWGDFTVIMFYDGQGFMFSIDSGIISTDDFDGVSVCVPAGTITEQNLSDFFRQNGMEFEAVIFADIGSVYNAFEEGRCDMTTADRTLLASVRTGFANPSAYTILPDIISKEPLSPAVPAGDGAWFDIVKIVMYGLITAEELGVTSANVDAMMSSDNINVRRLLGQEGDWGYTDLGLNPEALANAIRAVGNYAEIYDRNFGPNTVFALPRGLNELWSNGGLIYAPPVK